MTSVEQVDVFAATLIKLNRQVVQRLVEIEDGIKTWTQSVKRIEDACVSVAAMVNKSSLSLEGLTGLLRDRLVPEVTRTTETLSRLLANAEARQEDPSDPILNLMKASDDRTREWRLRELCESTRMLPRDALLKLDELVGSSRLGCLSPADMHDRELCMSDAERLVLSRMRSVPFGVEWTLAQFSGSPGGKDHVIAPARLKEALDRLESYRTVARVQGKAEGFWRSAEAMWVLQDDGRRWSLR
jgi:hypothetical protein